MNIFFKNWVYILTAAAAFLALSVCWNLGPLMPYLIFYSHSTTKNFIEVIHVNDSSRLAYTLKNLQRPTMILNYSFADWKSLDPQKLITELIEDDVTGLLKNDKYSNFDLFFDYDKPLFTSSILPNPYMAYNETLPKQQVFNLFSSIGPPYWSYSIDISDIKNNKFVKEINLNHVSNLGPIKPSIHFHIDMKKTIRKYHFDEFYNM